MGLPSAPITNGGPHPRVSSPAPARSTLITSAPRSPRIWPAQGPASTRANSRTRKPASGPAITSSPQPLASDFQSELQPGPCRVQRHTKSCLEFRNSDFARATRGRGRSPETDIRLPVIGGQWERGRAWVRWRPRPEAAARNRREFLPAQDIRYGLAISPFDNAMDLPFRVDRGGTTANEKMGGGLMTINRRHVLVGALATPALIASTRLGSAAAAVTLKISHQFPGGTIDEGDFRDRLCRRFAAELEKRTNGEVAGQVYPNSSLMKTVAQFSAMRKGALDISLYPISYAGGEFAELNIGLMPGLVSSYDLGAAWKNSA